MGSVNATGLRELNVGESADNLPIIDARIRWNRSGLWLTAGQSYEFKVDDVQNWCDAGIDSTPDEGHIKRRWYLEIPPAKWLRRFRKANWYTLVGSIGKSPGSYFPIGGGRIYTPETTGELLSFANDAELFYGNNSGTLRLTVIRLS